MNCLSYTLFGFNETHASCFDFRSYLRGLHINIRMAEVLYPGWKVSVVIDEPSYLSPYKPYFDQLDQDKKIDLYVIAKRPLCEMMLYRLLPLFQIKRGENKYDRVICRDTDSLLTYKERQAVAYWEAGPKMAHAITDSVSHTIALMGGMIGFLSGPFRDRMQANNIDDLLSQSVGIDFSRKGADQDFLNRYVLPKVADSITEHYLLGMPQSFRGDCHHAVQPMDTGTKDYTETNGLGFHIGASGFQADGAVKFLEREGLMQEYWAETERLYPEVFYWRL
jgi:hypothetical protein